MRAFRPPRPPRALGAALASALGLGVGLAACGREAPEAPSTPTDPEGAPGVVAAGASAPAVVAPHLLARRELPVAGKPLGLAALDLDGDDRAELVAALEEPGALAVWRGGPAGLAAAPVLLPIGAFPVGPVAVPRAGAPPLLAVASMRTRELAVLDPFARGAEPVHLVLLPATPRALAAGDAGGDGRADLVAALDDGTLAVATDGALAARRATGLARPTCVLFADGGRLLALGAQLPPRLALYDAAALARPGEGEAVPLRTLELAGIPRALAELDLDGDGDRELVVAGGDRSLWVLGAADAGGAAAWLAPDRAPLAVPATGNVPLAAAVADLAGDGSEELVLVCAYDSAYGVLGGLDPALGFCARSQSEYAGQTPRALALADLDGDGVLDLAVANRDAARVGLLPGTGRAGPGEPAFHQAARVSVAANPLDVAAGDLDGDGLPEAVAVGGQGGVVSVVRNRGGKLAERRDVEVGPAAARVWCADLDADGHIDVLVLRRPPEGARLALLFGDGRGGLDRRGLADLQPGPGVRDVALVPRGGRPWIACVDERAQALAVLVPTPAGEPWALARTLSLPIAPEPGAVAALGPDRVAVALGGGEPAVALVAVGEDALREVARGRAAGEPELLRAGDVDGDGRADLALLARERRGAPRGWVELWLGDGDHLAPAGRAETGLSPAGLALGDLDGDGRADAVVAAQNSHHANLWLARAGDAPARVQLERQPDLGAGIGCLAAAFADLDGDGALDVLVANAFSDDLSAIANRR